MNIYINFNEENILFTSKNYQSIHSIINDLLEQLNIKESSDNYFLTYNGKYLNINYSLEKYEIQNNSLLILNKKLKGGNGFFQFFSNNPVLVIICLIISIIPLFILPLGFIPSTASLLQIIIEKSFNKIGKYLVCTLGKKTLYSRIILFINFIKYIIFFLMIYVIITFPLIILCCTLKGHSIFDSPSSMCSPINQANTTGLILTVLYVFIYFLYRSGGYILNFFINTFDNIYILGTIFNPILKSLLNIFNKFKFIPVFFTPIIGAGLVGYFELLDIMPDAFMMILSTIINLGCKSDISTNSFKNMLLKKIKKNEIKTDNKEIKLPKLNSGDNLCVNDNIECCSKKNFIKIGDTLVEFINNPSISMKLKSHNIFPSFILFTESFYEEAISQLSKDNDTDIHMIETLKDKIKFLENTMKEFSIINHTQYIPGNSMTKIILKKILSMTFCNVVLTSKTTEQVIQEMGYLQNITDMLKSGSATGTTMSIAYFITLIVLIILGIFNKF